MQIDASTRVIYHNSAISAARVMATYASASDSPGTTNLVAWYTLDETSGTRADSHSGGYTLTDNNTVLYNTGKVSNAAAFVATNSEFLSYEGAAAAFDMTSDFTVAAWVNPATVPALASICTKSRNAAANTDWLLRVDGAGTGKPEFYTTNGSTYYGAQWGSGLSTSTWAFVVGWFSSADNKVYVQVDNGTPISTNTTGAPPGDANTKMIIGAQDSAAARRPWDGLIDEVAIYSRVLTADERTFLYNSGNGRTYTDL